MTDWQGAGAQGDDKAWKLLEKVSLQATTEQRRARRWGIFFKFLTFFYLFALLGAFSQLGNPVSTMNANKPHTGVVSVRGVIAAGEEASAGMINKAIRDAYDNENLRGLVININSPGGSPVQSGQVYRELKRLKQLHPEIPVYAVINDVGASGAYYIASGADEIYADGASLVGSIGVVSASFGFNQLMERYGVERRVYTAGERKVMMDPFMPESAEDVAHWQTILKSTHRQFINVVKEGRGDRLVQDTPGLFEGMVWSGEQAVEIGLVDGLASARELARTKIGESRLVDYTVSLHPMDRLVRQLESRFSAQSLFPSAAMPTLY